MEGRTSSDVPDRQTLNPSAWSEEHCSSQRKHHMSWSDEQCSSWGTLSLIRLYLDHIGSKFNRAALCLFVKQPALLWCGRQLLEIISLFFSLLSNFRFSICSCGVTSTVRHGARLHSFSYISTTWGENVIGGFVLVREGAGSRMVWETFTRNYFFIFFPPFVFRVFVFAVPNFTDGFMRPSNSEMKQ